MSTVAKVIEDCKHSWWLLLEPSAPPALQCRSCDAYDDEVFNGGVAQHVWEEIGDKAWVRGGHHNYTGPGIAQIPVHLYVRQSQQLDTRTMRFEPQVEVTVTPRLLPPEGESGPLNIEAAVDEAPARQLPDIEIITIEHVADTQPGVGTGWCSPSP